MYIAHLNMTAKGSETVSNSKAVYKTKTIR